MQQQFWITRQALSRKFGRKEDKYIAASDAELDAKLELFRNIQMSCTCLQRIIDRYQEAICYLSHQQKSMGMFLKENGNEDKTLAGEIMLNLGKVLTYCAQQQIVLYSPLLRFYQELNTFQHQAISDTLQNILVMEKARTEYRATLMWMKNISQQLDPDTTKQLEKFKKVQDQVRKGKTNFDKLAFDCLQKVDLLAAARCNMLNHVLSSYYKNVVAFTDKSAEIYLSTIKITDCQNSQDEGNDDDIRQIKKSTKYNIDKNKMTDRSLKNESFLLPEIEDLLSNVSIENISQKSHDNYSGNGLSVDDEETIIAKLTHAEDTDTLQNITSESNNILNDVFINEPNSTDNLYKSYNTDEADSFLPSALLNQSLKHATRRNDSGNKQNFQVKQTNTNNFSESWLNLFEELDPLSRKLHEKLNKDQNSFV